MDFPTHQPPPREPVPSSDLIRISAGGAIAALLSGFMFGYIKTGSSGMKYFMTGSYFGDGMVAGLLAGVVTFFVCSRIAERVVETLDRKLPAAQYAMIALGGGVGFFFGMFLTICINFLGAKFSS